MDFLFVNSVPFHISKSRKIEYGTIAAVDNLSVDTMLKCSKSIITKYKSRGINIDEIMADNQFKPIADKINPTLLNVCAPNEHVGDIENFIKIIKERSRCVHSALPYGLRWPRVMTVGLMEYLMRMLNSFPSNVGVSTTLSPATIVEGRRPIDARNISLPFGAYVQLTVENTPTNSMKPRTIPAISLGPSGNTQGTYYFMNLLTGKRVHGRTWQRLPITTDIINSVHRLAEKQRMPDMPEGPIFEWRRGLPILPPVASDDDSVSSDDASVSESVASDTAATPPRYILTTIIQFPPRTPTRQM